MDLEITILNEINKSEKDKYHDTTYMWNLKKKIQMNLFTKQMQTHRLRGPTNDYLGENGLGDRLGVWDCHVHIKHTIFKIYNERGLTV